MVSRFRGFVLTLALTCAACAPALTKLPKDPGINATNSDVRDALAEATAVCGTLKTLSAEAAVSGSVGGQRIRGRLLVGVAVPDSARIEVVAPFGPPIFIFVSRNRDATLLLPRDDRILQHGKPSELLEAAAGLPLDAADLWRALSACPADPAPAGHAVGDRWRIVADKDALIYLHRDKPSARWQVVSVLHSPPNAAPWRSDYQNFQAGVPRSVRLTSPDRRSFDLRLALSQVDVNPALADEAFTVQIPRSAQPITIDELKRARPGVREN